jgi:tRNA nucleotidyltransferase (CCA-adding enzyme)
LVEGLCARLRAPARFCDPARLVARYHGLVHRAAELRNATVLRVLEAADAFRRPGRLDTLLLASEADYRGRLGFEVQPYPQARQFRDWRAAAAAVDAGAVARACARPELVAEAVARARIAAIAACPRAVPEPR